MRINILKLSVVAAVITGSLTFCTDTSKDKVDNAEEKVEEAKKDVVDAKEELQQAKADSVTEYAKFKADMNLQLKANDAKIAELKEKLKMEKKETRVSLKKRWLNWKPRIPNL